MPDEGRLKLNLKFGSTEVILKRDDITRETVDAIVNAANSGLVGGGGVDGAIHRAGGPTIMEACDAIRAKQGGCPTGEAVVTTAGKLNARYVIHTVGPVYRDGDCGEPAQLRSAYTRSLRLAAETGARTVAFPSISTGVYGYPVEPAARVALQAVWDFSVSDARLTEVRFVLFSDRDLAVYEAAAGDLDR